MGRRKGTSYRGNANRSGIFKLLSGTIIAALLLFLIGPRLVGFISGAPDYSGPGSGSVQIEISAGDSIAKIGNVLKEAKVVKSVDAFTSAAANNPDSSKISPGFYNMMLEMKASDAVALLLDPKSKVVYRAVIPEGKRASDIYALIAQLTGIPVTDFEAVAANPSQLALPAYANGQVEGFLFPATYEFPPGTTALSAMQAMVNKFNAVAKEMNLDSTASTFGKTPYEILTIASILEVEAHPTDFAKVSRVIYNRLAAPMRLQFDSTVNYGLGKTDVIITTENLKKKTPFNTYLNDGLPPTPIGNPGVASIVAALTPADGDWLYFITTNLKTQETKFTSSYEEFLKFKDEFLAYCDANPGTCFK
jgi:UPF0755 protein